MKSLEFEWKLGDYKIHACPKRLVRFSDEEPNETIDFCKIENDCRFSIAYFKQDKDGFWDLNLCGERFWDYVPKEDWIEVMTALKMAHQTLNECCGMVEE